MNHTLTHLHPVLQRIYQARHIQSADELNYDIKRLLHFGNLKGIKTAAKLLGEAIINQQRILIVGDFDVDGATSTTLSVLALRAFGAKHVQYLVPNRFEYGYGLTPEIVAIADSPDIIMTVDNGISSYEGVVAAQQLGIKVVVTDHHLPPEILPPADAIVNPQQEGDLFESKSLAGVGVAFYVMLAVRQYLQECNWFKNNEIEYPKMNRFLDLVALGTVADMVPLDMNNRILVYYGVRQLRLNLTRPGIRALAQVAQCDLTKCIASDLSFLLAPRLNAAGRLTDMSLGIECLLAHDMTTALDYASQLDCLNRERRDIEQTMQKKAFSAINRVILSNEQASICLFDSAWHQGVTGLVAGRIKERWKRPAIVFAPSNTPDELKGSARSIPGIHIRDVLATIAAQYPHLLSRFGGHAAAAGLSLKTEHYPQFKTIFEEKMQAIMHALKPKDMPSTDGSLTCEELNVELAMLIREAGPWGQNFPEPLFEGYFEIISQRLVGQRHLQLKLKMAGVVAALKGILFNVDVDQWPNLRVRQVKALYRLEVNEWEGRRDIQLKVESLLSYP
jgi:single-stranded-DNA-specific exonuclease